MLNFLPAVYINFTMLMNGRRVYTDQPKRKAFLFAFRRGTPLARKKKKKKNNFEEKTKNHLFRRGFSLRNFAEKLRDISRTSAGFCDG